MLGCPLRPTKGKEGQRKYSKARAGATPWGQAGTRSPVLPPLVWPLASSYSDCAPCLGQPPWHLVVPVGCQLVLRTDLWVPPKYVC